MNAKDSDVKNIVGIQQMLVLFTLFMLLLCNSMVGSLKELFLLRYKIFKNPQALLVSPTQFFAVKVPKIFYIDL